jgi:hypothetical protein
MPGRWVRGEGKKCDQGGPPGKQLVGCLRHFAFSKFRIFRMFFWVSYAIRKWPQFREIIRNFSCHFSMQIYTKFRVFREILWLFIPIFQRFITDDIFHTQQRNFKTLIGGGAHRMIGMPHSCGMVLVKKLELETTKLNLKTNTQKVHTPALIYNWNGSKSTHNM